MKFRVLYLMAGLASVLSATAAETNSASTNKASASAPPMTLAQALKTNVVGTYKISPTWTGKCEVAYATGTFKAPEPAVFASNRYDLKFDLAVIPPKAAVGNVGPKAIARIETNGGYRALHTFRESLPGDAKIRSATTLAGLEKVLGRVQGFPAAPGYGAEGRSRLTWSLFAINEGNLDTLQVSAVVEKSGDGRVESLEIVRGVARPEIKPPKKS